MEPNVKLSHPERGYGFGVVISWQWDIRSTQAAERLGVGCSALLGPRAICYPEQS